MDGRHHHFNGREFEHTLRDSEGQGSLVCCSPWGHKESSPGEENGNPFQYSCLENPMDRGTSCSKVHRFAKSRTQLKQISKAELELGLEPGSAFPCTVVSG